MSVSSASRTQRLIWLLLATAILAVPSSARAQTVVAGPPVVVDGPSPAIVSMQAMSIARDGTGGIVFLKQVSGSPHVFVSRLVGGAFEAPQQLDAGLPGPSSEPVIAAGRHGLLLVAFINGGQLFVVNRTSGSVPFSAPHSLFAGAMHPAIAITDFGKAYLAFTADAGPSNHDVRAAYYYKGGWSLEPTALDASASDDAGTGSGRPAVAASGDGVGTVVWGELGHLYSRRVWGTSPSVVYEQADIPSLGGWNEVSAGEPVAGSGGNSSYVAVGFREIFSNGESQQSRVLLRRLHGSLYDLVTGGDGLGTPGAEGADQPQIAVGEYGTGLLTAAHQQSHQLFATVLGGDDVNTGTSHVDTLPNTGAPDAVPAMAGLFSDLVAWQQAPGTVGMPEIRVRYSDDGSALGPEQVVSPPALGPTNAASGLAAGGDVDGNAAIAWVQGSGGSTRIVARQLYRPPGSFGPRRRLRYARSRHPRLRWTAAREHWGLTYSVKLDGVQVGQTGATSFAVPVALTDGPHRWRVIATNAAGQSSVAPAGTVWVDTVRPRARIRIRGSRRVGARLRLRIAYSDPAPPSLPNAASGVAKVMVKWGDGVVITLRHGAHARAHTYRAAGRYKLTVVVVDKAGNRTVLVRRLQITSGGGSRRHKRHGINRPAVA